MVRVKPLRSTRMLIPPAGISWKAPPPPGSRYAVPSGRNSIVCATAKGTDESNVRTGPSRFGSVFGFKSVGGYGYSAALQRVAAESAATGAADVPINSTARYSPADGQLNRTRIGRDLATARDFAIWISRSTSRAACPRRMRSLAASIDGRAIADTIPMIAMTATRSTIVNPRCPLACGVGWEASITTQRRFVQLNGQRRTQAG